MSLRNRSRRQESYGDTQATPTNPVSRHNQPARGTPGSSKLQSSRQIGSKPSGGNSRKAVSPRSRGRNGDTAQQKRNNTTVYTVTKSATVESVSAHRAVQWITFLTTLPMFFFEAIFFLGFDRSVGGFIWLSFLLTWQFLTMVVDFQNPTIDPFIDKWLGFLRHLVMRGCSMIVLAFINFFSQWIAVPWIVIILNIGSIILTVGGIIIILIGIIALKGKVK